MPPLIRIRFSSLFQRSRALALTSSKDIEPISPVTKLWASSMLVGERPILTSTVSLRQPWDS